MLKPILTAALALAATATVASAVVAPAARPTDGVTLATPVAEKGDDRRDGKSGNQRRAAPSGERRGPPVIERRMPSVERRMPSVERRAPIVRETIRRPVIVDAPRSRGYSGPGRTVVYVRPHKRRNYYGRVIGGVALGSILAASAYYAYASSPPDPDLCWYWTSSSQSSGYWDYCEIPEDDDD